MTKYQFATVDGQKIFYREAGTKTAPNILLLHRGNQVGRKPLHWKFGPLDRARCRATESARLLRLHQRSLGDTPQPAHSQRREFVVHSGEFRTLRAFSRGFSYVACFEIFTSWELTCSSTGSPPLTGVLLRPATRAPATSSKMTVGRASPSGAVKTTSSR